MTTTLTTIEGIKIGERFRCACEPDMKIYERVEPMPYNQAFYCYKSSNLPSWMLMRSRVVLSSGKLGGFYLTRPEIILETL